MRGKKLEDSGRRKAFDRSDRGERLEDAEKGTATGFRFVLCVLCGFLSDLAVRAFLLDSELFSRVRAEAFWGPRWSPYDIHSTVSNAGQLFDARFHLGADVDVLGTALSGEGHFDGNILLWCIWILSGGGDKIHFVN